MTQKKPLDLQETLSTGRTIMGNSIDFYHPIFGISLTYTFLLNEDLDKEKSFNFYMP